MNLFAISKIKVTAAILLHCTGPVFVAFYAAIFRKQKPTARSLTALLGTVVGCFLKGAMPTIDLWVTPCPDIWGDGHRRIWLNPRSGLNPKYRGTGTLGVIAPFRK